MMEKIRELRKKFFSTELPIRQCIFNMMTCIAIMGVIVSLISTIIMGIDNRQTIAMIIGVLVLMFVLYLANYKDKLDMASILLVVMISLIILPVMFIKGGGVQSGMLLWFMGAILFDAILIRGKAKYILFALCMIEYVGLVYVAYKFPDFLQYFPTREAVFMDIGQSLIFVSFCIVLIVSFQVYMYDMAYKKVKETVLEAEKARREADAANAAKSLFLANMSHEIRTPMGVIIGMNEMIKRESNQEVVKDYSDDVTAAANSLLSIINDILDFSKIESGKMSIVESEYELRPLISDISNMAKIKQEESGLELDIVVDDQLPSRLYGDDIRIKQCLINIVSNAFKYTEKGKITISIKGEKLKDKERVTFSVKDTGKGIKDEDKEKLFESFVRLDEAKNKGIQGTGLGLNITNRLLNLMGSKLEVVSSYGIGSEFFFTLEQTIIDDKPISAEKSLEDKAEKVEESGLAAKEADILVVDDSKMNLKVFCSLLKKTKLRIDTALGGQEAIDKVRGKHYDIIFLDHMMPEMDGEQTLQALRQEHLVDNTPVIMLTANAIVGMKEHFLEVGFDDYLSKPIVYVMLEEILLRHLK